MYIEALAAPDTINTIPDKTLKAFADHGQLHGAMASDGSDCEAMLARVTDAGVDIDALAQRLQADGAQAFVKSWQQLMQVIESKGAELGTGTAG